MAETFDVSGYCLCGAVGYKAKAASHDVGACHCGMCRRWTGGPLMFIDVIGKPEFTGADSIGIYRSSETGERGFCSKCGSVLFWKTANADIYTFTAGSLDDQSKLVFAKEIYIEDKPHFYDFANDTIKQTGAEGMQAYTGAGAETE